MKSKNILLFLVFLFVIINSFAQKGESKFSQLETLLPSPNGYRTASGAPGSDYWQQKTDYKINIKLVDEEQRIYGDEVITYHNQSPDVLTYLWVQLEQNKRALDSDSYKIKSDSESEGMSMAEIPELHPNFDGGFKIEYVKTADGKTLPYTINKTMMRIDLPQPIKSGESFSFQIKWWYTINDRALVEERSGYEYFPKDDNRLYVIAQFYPRLAVYTDYAGWQNKQFLGQGEFTLGFGDFDVNLTLPVDFVVAATGELQNPNEVLNKQQIDRLANARKSFDKPVLIVQADEAKKNEISRKTDYKTWTFKAKNVRDFAFAGSRKFIWDAQAVDFNGKTVMAMSFYPKEGNPLWEEFSTKAVVHTLKSYSRFTFDFPYPVAQSIHAANIGMEYPMICFNGGRPMENGKYATYIKNSMLSVIIHEVGHNFFPMIVNSDERQWSWMDEGLNTFVQYLAEQEWEENYPSWAGKPSQIVSYMKSDKKYQSPIMVNSESAKQFSYNAYYKPATALNILRETIMGHELFDKAFKEYSQRWMFKHPTPADFFRTMEDASAVDLDWFWRAWFYGTDPVDIAIDKVSIFHLADDSQLGKNNDDNSKYKVELLSLNQFNKYYSYLLKERKDFKPENYYYAKIAFSNKGGVVMPLIVKFEYEDGTSEIQRIPVEIWVADEEKVTKTFVCSKKIARIILDPNLETADVNTKNNVW